ncbi:C-Jun-amino-terminal kinase-interacting protein 4-like isoform X7 [Tachypleus tridentatus]|uniref:C-Jun-amino-terminal kinase-interacting protein 4-like isoform X7 n=1 Tax=Tachypleus tridentatus TaxID=6853 RepID=UPI003FCF3C02
MVPVYSLCVLFSILGTLQKYKPLNSKEMESSPTSPMQETVYGTSNDENHVVMSEKVQNLAGSIYQEFQKMIARYDEDVVKELMPLVVNVLESLDLAYMDIQEHEVELELLREDNEQLVTQYEREKQLRKSSEQKLLEYECAIDDDRQEQMGKIESLESIVRMLELKAKNVGDHASRLEEKESDMKKEYSKLHERYTELFKTHMDYMERTKILFGTDRLENLSNKQKTGYHLSHLKSGGTLFNMNSGDSFVKPLNSPLDFPSIVSPSTDSNTSLKSELHDIQSPSTITSPTNHAPGTSSRSTLDFSSKEMSDKSQLTEQILQNDRGTATRDGWVDGFGAELSDVISTTPELEDIEDISQDSSIGIDKVSLKREQRRPNTLYQELSFHDTDALGEVDEGADISGGYVHPGEFASSDSDSETENEHFSKVSDNFFGMGKEVENLILENNELLATKEHEILREEIKSLDSVKERLKQRVNELEEEVKKLREAEKNKTNKSDDEEDVPMAQRKRFTRVEMARVLMERNQYKERLMELQEAVRWTEMIRASRNDPTECSKKNKSSIWKFFSNLFNASERPQRKSNPYVNVHYNAPTSHVTPALDTMRKKKLGDRHRGLDFLDTDLASERLQEQRAKERKEQYKQVRAHVRKDDGRMQAYGWSLPTKAVISGPKPPPDDGVANTLKTSSSHVRVPVPIYCRPLLEKEPGMKIWCASGVNLTGGRTADGGSVVGASIFYSSPSEKVDLPKEETVLTEVDKLDNELKESEKDRRESEQLEQNLTSLVWICTSTHSSSKVTVIDANNPADILDSFHVCSSHLLCIASVPGAKETDYPVDDKFNKLGQEKNDTEDTKEDTSLELLNDKVLNNGTAIIGNITFISCATGTAMNNNNNISEFSPKEKKPVVRKQTSELSGNSLPNDECKWLPDQNDQSCYDEEDIKGILENIRHYMAYSSKRECVQQGGLTIEQVAVEAEEGSVLFYPSFNLPVEEAHTDPSGATQQKDRNGRVEETRQQWLLGSESDLVKDGLSEVSRDNQLAYDQIERMSSVLPTMWLGSQDGSIFVHSSMAQWKRCIHSVHLKDSVLSIVHIKGRVFVALADGTVAVFHRAEDGQWDLSNYHLLDLGHPHHSVRCMAVVFGKIWCGYRNRIHVVDPKSLSVVKSFDAHPRKESQVRQMAWIGDGVWISIRLDSTLRMYHAHTYQHLQDVDIEPYVSKMLGTGKLGFSFIRITALLVSCNRLWMGTGNGVTISVPLSEASKQTSVSGTGRKAPGGMVRVYSDTKDNVTPGSFIPYCSMAQAQLSFHGHRDAVKFFVAVPGQGGMSGVSTPADNRTSLEQDKGNSDMLRKPKHMLVISGGEGYIDFRIGDGDEEEDGTGEKCHHGLSKGDRSHLIVWQVALA